MFVKKSIELNATVEDVWNLLTNSEMTKQYMFGCEVISDWEKGSDIIWKGKTEDGQEIIYVKGEILEIEENKKLKITMFDPNMGIADIPENYVSLLYQLTQNKKTTTLLLEQGDYTNVEKSQERYDDTIKGWDYVLPLMKNLVEEK